jgi:endonuclease III
MVEHEQRKHRRTFTAQDTSADLELLYDELEQMMQDFRRSVFICSVGAAPETAKAITEEQMNAAIAHVNYTVGKMAYITDLITYLRPHYGTCKFNRTAQELLVRKLVTLKYDELPGI